MVAPVRHTRHDSIARPVWPGRRNCPSLLLEGYVVRPTSIGPRRGPPCLRMPTAYLLQGKPLLPRGGKHLGGTDLYATQKIAGLFQKTRQPTLATRTSTATSLLFLFAILTVGMTSMYSFRTQLTNVMIAEQNTLVERIADNLDQKLRALQRALLLSAIEITEADVASSDKEIGRASCRE